MGVHSTVRDGRACTVCRVWAPECAGRCDHRRVLRLGPKRYPLEKIDDAVWEGYTDEPLEPYTAYSRRLPTRPARRF